MASERLKFLIAFLNPVLATRSKPMGNNTSAAGADDVDAPATPHSDSTNSASVDSAALKSPTSSSSSPTVGTNSSTSGAITEVIEFKMCDPEKEAPIQINVTITSSKTNEVIRYAGVHFHPCGKNNWDRVFSISDAKLVEEAALEPDQKKYTVQFKYTAAVVFGIDFIPSDWPIDITEALVDLKRYLTDGVTRLTLTSADKAIGSGSVGARLASLSQPGVRTLLTDYVEARPGLVGGGLGTYDDLVRRYCAGSRHAIGKSVDSVPVSHVFSSPEIARAKLTHGRYIDQEWEKITSKDVFKGSFGVVFLKTNHGKAILACIRKTGGNWDPRDSSTKAVMSNRSAINLIFSESCSDGGNDDDDEIVKKGSNDGRSKVAFGTLTLNRSAITCDFALLMDPKVIPLDVVSKARSWAYARSVSNSSFEPVVLEIKDYDQARLQIDAINTFLRHESFYREWWQGFTGVSNGKETYNNWLKDKLGVSQEQIDAVVDQTRVKMLNAGMTLNTEQENILKTIGQTHHGWTLWRGPPGTGKSTTIALMTYSLLQFEGVAVYAAAPSNGATSKLFGSIKQWMQLAGVTDPTKLPLRVFRKYHEQCHLRSALFPTRDDKEENAKKSRMPQKVVRAAELEEDDWYTRQLLAEDKRLMDDPNNGLMAAVLKTVRDGKFNEQPLARTSVGPRDGRHYRQYHHYHAAKASLLKLQAKQKNPDIMYPREDRDKYVKDVTNQVLGERRCVVSTVSNATNLLMRDGVFRDARSIVIIVDEQSLDTDYGTLGILAGLINEQRVVFDFNKEPPVVQIILVGDDKQGRPVVKSAQDGVNVFGSQLTLSTFERLIQVGMPVQTLLEQHRMAPILRELPSERCYGGQLRDSQEAIERRLADRQVLHLQALFGQNPLSLDTSENPNAYLRSQLFDVDHSEYLVDRQTRSRHNPANLIVTLALVAYLINKQVVQPAEIVILTLYNAQKTYYIHQLGELERRLGLPKGTFDDTVETSDSFQGRERKCVILDLVVTSYTGSTSLGNVGDERRMNVACTRARDLFFVVGTMRLLESRERFTGRLEYVMALLARFRERKAIKSGKAMELKAKLAI